MSRSTDGFSVRIRLEARSGVFCPGEPVDLSQACVPRRNIRVGRHRIVPLYNRCYPCTVSDQTGDFCHHGQHREGAVHSFIPVIHTLLACPCRFRRTAVIGSTVDPLPLPGFQAEEIGLNILDYPCVMSPSTEE